MVPRRVPGAVGIRAARQFTAASSQYLVTTSLVPLIAPPFTVAGWFRPEVATATRTLWCLGDTGTTNNYYRLTYDESVGQELDAEARDAFAITQSTRGGATEGAWNHAAGVYSSTTSRTAYLNGVAGTTDTASASPASLDSMTFGRLERSTPSQYMDGALSSWGIWSAALTAGEIAQLAQGAHPTAIRPSSLLECWEFDRMGPIVGLVRGTVLTPVNGGSLTVGPPIQGAPVLDRMPLLVRAGGTNYTLSADSGTVTATGTSARTLYSRVTSAASAAVAATGTAARLLYLRVLAALSAALALTGTTARTLWQRLLSAASGAWTATGTTATTLWHRVIRAETATVEVTGTAATLDYSGDTGPSVDERRKVFMLMGIYK